MLSFGMQKLVNVLCVLITAPLVLSLLMSESVSSPFMMLLLLGFLVVLLLNWFFNINKPIPEIMRLAFRSFLITIAANFAIGFLLLLLFFLTLQAGWCNR